MISRISSRRPWAANQRSKFRSSTTCATSRSRLSLGLRLIGAPGASHQKRRVCTAPGLLGKDALLGVWGRRATRKISQPGGRLCSGHYPSRRRLRAICGLEASPRGKARVRRSSSEQDASAQREPGASMNEARRSGSARSTAKQAEKFATGVTRITLPSPRLALELSNDPNWGGSNAREYGRGYRARVHRVCPDLSRSRSVLFFSAPYFTLVAAMSVRKLP